MRNARRSSGPRRMQCMAPHFSCFRRKWAARRRLQNGWQGASMSALEKFPRITPFLWFNANVEDAVNFYLSIFKNSRRLDEFRPEGKLMTIAFELDGQRFTAFNGGPMYKFTEAISMVVRCDSQEEVDYYWSRLAEGGKEIQCGWLKTVSGCSGKSCPR